MCLGQTDTSRQMPEYQDIFQLILVLMILKHYLLGETIGLPVYASHPLDK